jgi:filamentous hemagglutinin family protein
MTRSFEVRPTVRGRVIGVGLGQFRFVGSGVALLLAAMLAPCALAGPNNGKVSQGKATITTIGGKTVIRSSNGTIIDWATFNLNKDEYVKFLQASGNSKILNRINSATPSSIDGRIWSNGTVYFSNPAGVIFGPNAVLNVGGIYAAAGHISNQDFASGLNRFTDVHGTVSNAGKITTAEGGLAALVGERVVNTGTITAPHGVIAMVAGNEVTFLERGGTMSVRVENDAGAASGKDGAAIENSGTIGADRGSAFMVAGDMYSLAVRNAPTGVVRARDIKIEGKGKAGVEVAGTLDASNQRGNGKGGSISVTGETVALTGATLDASGQREGGDIRVGGEYQGGAGLRSATNTSVDDKTTITADAVGSGNGGRVIVWANDTTHVGGTISANGGAASGDGGFIETSGHLTLDIRGAKIQARALAAGGKAGLWLMDPTNVDIADPTSGDDTTGVTVGGPGTTVTPDGSGPAIVDVNTINAALNGGTNVTVLTGAVGTDDGNIRVNAAVLKSAGGDATFTLHAANDIQVNSTITSTVGKLNVDLHANSSALGNDDLDPTSGSVSINAAIATNGGTFSSSGVNYTQNAGGTIATTGGAVTINHTGAVAINDTLNAGMGTVAITSTGSTISAPGQMIAGDVSLSGMGAVSATQVTSSGTVTFNGGADVTIGAGAGATSLTIGPSLANGGVTITAPDVNIAGVIQAGSGGITLQPDTDAKTVGINASGADFSLSLAELQNLQTSGTVTIGRATGTGTNFIGGLSAVDLSSTSYDLTLRGGQAHFNDTLTLANDKTLTLRTAGVAGQASGTDVVIGGTAGALVVDSTAAASLTTQVEKLAAQTTAGALAITNTGLLEIASIGSVNGVSGAPDQNVTITTSGDLTLSSAVATTGMGTIALTSQNGSVTFNTGSSATAGTAGGMGTITVLAANDIVAPGDATDLLTAGTINLTATTGGIGIANPLRINASTLRATAATEVTIASSGTGTLDAAITGGPGATIDLSHAGLLSIATSQTISGGKITLTAADIDVSGTVNSSDVLTIARGTNGTIGVGDAIGDMVISKTELARLTAQTLVIGSTTATGITANNVAASDLTNVNAVTLLALADGGDVTFSGSPSTFKNLLVRADDSIRVQTSLTSAVGTLSLHADDDGMSDTDGDRITISDGAVISTTNMTGGAIVLSATGGIAGAGSVLIDSNTDLTIDNAITSAGTMTLNAKGAQTLNGTVAGAGITMNAGAGIAIMQNVTSTGPNGIMIDADHDQSGAGTLSLASGATINTTNQNLSILAADVSLDGMVQAGTGSVSIGRSSAGTIGVGSGTGDMQVSGSELGGIHAATVTIGSANTTGMTVDTIAAGDTAGITNLLSFVTDAIDITGPINTSSAGLSITRATMGDIAVGSAVGGLNISSAELAQITAKSLTIGDATVTHNVFVNGVASADTAGIDGAVTFIASNTVSFIAAPSTFKSLTVRANNGIHINVNLTTTVGDMDLNGDVNGTTDTDDAITIASSKTLSSAGQLLLRSQTGGIVGNGSLTLEANTGITIFNDMTTSGLTTIDADHNANGDGDLTVSSGRVLATSGNELRIIASDLTLDGSIQTNAGSVSITRSSLGTIGLGTATGNMTISNDELGRIIATGMTIGGPSVTRMIVSGVSSTSANGIAGTTTLTAGGKIVFNNGASTFNALDVKATRGVRIASDLSTDNGKLRIDGDSDHTGGDVITLNANLTADIPPATSGGAPTVVFNVALLSDVVLGASSVIIGHDITFTGAIDSASGTSRALTVNTFNSGVTSFGGDIGVKGRLFTLATNNDGSTLLGGMVKTNGAIGFSDQVFLTRDTTIDETAGQGLTFVSTLDTASTAAHEMSLTVLMPLGSAPAGINFPTISFTGNVGSTRALRDINLNTDGTPGFAGRANVPAIATIFARPRDSMGNVDFTQTNYSITFNTTGAFRMGTNEKLTVDGPLTINAAHVVLGDVVTIGNLRVNSPDIVIQRRAPGKLLTQSGGVGQDQGVDFVVGGTIDLTSTPTIVGAGNNPRFGTPDGGGDVGGTLSGFVFQATGPISHGDINPTGNTLRTLDLSATGPTNTNIATALAGAIPEDVRQNEVTEETTLTPTSFAEAEALGINLRNPTASELVSILGGAGTTYSDYTPTNDLMTAEDTTTVVTRLPAERVQSLLTAYQDAFTKPLLDDDGKPILDPSGQPRRVSKAQEMQDALYESVRRYREASKIKSSDVDPGAFRAYLEQTPAEAESLGYVRQLEDFLNKLEMIGLTARELNQSKAIILNPIRPRGIRNVQQFEQIIRADRAGVMR